MNRPSKTDRAAEIGVSMQCLQNWARCGVDIWNDDEVRAKVRRSRNLPPTIKAAFAPSLDGAVAMASPDDPTPVDIETIIARLGTVKDKHEAQTAKLQIDGLLNAYKLREAAGQYVSRTDVNETMVRLGVVFKAAVKRMEADLPPMLEGLGPAECKRLIGDKVDEVLATLEDEYEKAFQYESEPR